ncbi:thiamine pyrophosphate-binding protein [Kaistia dalseonensis]|uniref:Acetolactate synthase-1/2/3 large subunit n=1 Tax=Kaistia dalseonensis TaxID=410840 RepID=A0ABU0H8B3_9HYPH|nr:thiamine pyrophosphate-binding protein [Kaistia dalseonensis]MCX5495946.1 thiamine pyrophosphate-binding protein [Kaistia dalseonensis]MDQ0438549.1 acetolactate synthase-1/2/3 large subunit [Kaistia dalseonensis]
MISPLSARTGGELIVDALAANGVERVFCVPGESFLAVLDALHDSPIEVTVARQEGGAAMMAEAWGKMTGRPGVAIVTRGPGATNAASGLHVAMQDSTPMILLIGQIGRGMREREAFQEIDYRRMFGEVVKWVAEIDEAARIPELLSRAFHVATSGRPGPVVLAMPEDMLRETASVLQPQPFEPLETYPGLTQTAQLQKLLWAAKRPFVILGGSRWSDKAIASVQRFAERFDLPVGVSFRRQGLFDHEHPNYAGDVGIGPNPALAARIKAADLLLLIGGRMSETPSSGYTLIDIPEPRQQLVHIHGSAEELGRVYRPTLAINATPNGFAAQLEVVHPPVSIPWGEETRAANAAYRAWSDPAPRDVRGVELGAVMRTLREELPDDAILTNGAGNYAGWLHRYYRFKKPGTQLAPTSGSMGYGVPAAVAAKLRYPERTVVAFAGDGCFQMTGQEFGTAAQEGAAIIVIVVDNGIYGTIRAHQEKNYPGRVEATMLVNPDFAALARAYGAHGETVERTEEFWPAFQRAKASGKPAIIHVKTDPEAIAPGATITSLRGSSPR